MAHNQVTKRNELPLEKKYEVIKMARKNPKMGTRKLAEHFKCGKTQVRLSFLLCKSVT